MTSETETLVPKALEYYDKTRESYKDLFNKVKDYKLNISAYDMERNKIIFLDEDGKELLTSEYEVAGIYSNLYKIWVWAWSVPSFKKNLQYISRKILNYGLELDTSYFLKTELITSRFRITDPIQLDIHVAIAAYLSKKVAYNYKYYPDKAKEPNNYITYYIFLLSLESSE